MPEASSASLNRLTRRLTPYGSIRPAAATAVAQLLYLATRKYRARVLPVVTGSKLMPPSLLNDSDLPNDGVVHVAFAARSFSTLQERERGPTLFFMWRGWHMRDGKWPSFGVSSRTALLECHSLMLVEPFFTEGGPFGADSLESAHP